MLRTIRNGLSIHMRSMAALMMFRQTAGMMRQLRFRNLATNKRESTRMSKVLTELRIRKIRVYVEILLAIEIPQ